jgi:hypothetical protein
MQRGRKRVSSNALSFPCSFQPSSIAYRISRETIGTHLRLRTQRFLE